MSTWQEAMRAALPEGSCSSDDDLLASLARDHDALSPAGRASLLVRPRSTEEVATVLRIAHDRRVPVVTRGAGSGLMGGANAIDGCVLLHTTRMNQILRIDPASMLAVVQPGVVNAELGRALSAHGLWYPPDPASYEFSSIGGNVATNAGGLCCVKYGQTAEWILSLEAVLADGRVLRTGAKSRKSVAGYDLTRLLVGSEGTLGVVTEITARVRPARSRQTATLLGFFPSLDSAGRAVSALVARSTPSLLEILDQCTLQAIEAYRPMQLDTQAAAMLLLRYDEGDEGAALELAEALCHEAGASSVLTSDDPQEGELLMNARRLAFPALEHLGHTLLDDVAVPIAHIPHLLAAIEQIAAQHALTIGTFGHAGDGNMHPTIVFDAHDPQSVARARAAFDALVDAALALGGTVTGEHGVGLLKRDALERELSPVSLEVHRAIKQALDPHGILNPGKMLRRL